MKSGKNMKNKEEHLGEKIQNIENTDGNSISVIHQETIHSMENASTEYGNICIKRDKLIEKIVIENITEVKWVYGLLGETIWKKNHNSYFPRFSGDLRWNLVHTISVCLLA